MRLNRPSTGTVLGGLALFVALGGTALAATGQLVNIADGSNAAHVARVDATGRLQVGDAAGPLNVAGTVTAQQAAPVNYFHQTTFAITTSRGCLVIAIPPARRALVVRDVRVDVFADPTPGPDNDLVVFGDATCTDTVGDVNPGALGETVLPFDPGLGVAATSGLSARATGGVEAETYVDGYTVAPSSVPAAAAAVTTGRGGPSQG